MFSSIYVIIAILFIALAMWLVREDTLKYTMLNSGLILATAFAWDIPLFLAFLFLCTLPFVWLKSPSTSERLFAYLIGNAFTVITLFTLKVSFDNVWLIMLLLNLAMILLAFVVRESGGNELLKRNALFL